jgi:hypothetical protein
VASPPFSDIKVCIDVWDVQTDELKDKWKSLAGLGWEVVDVDHNKYVADKLLP